MGARGFRVPIWLPVGLGVAPLSTRFLSESRDSLTDLLNLRLELGIGIPPEVDEAAVVVECLHGVASVFVEGIT